VARLLGSRTNSDWTSWFSTRTDEDFLNEVAVGIRRGELFPVYRPVVDAWTGALDSVAVCVAWAHPMLGLVRSRAFVPRLVASGGARGLAARILEVASSDAAGWPVVAGCAPGLRIDTPVDELNRGGLECLAASKLESSGLSPRRVLFRVPDARGAGPVARESVRQLRAQGLPMCLGLTDLSRAGIDDALAVRPDQISVLLSSAVRLAGAAGPDGASLEPLAAELARARAVGVRLVVTGVQDRRQLAAARGLGADLVHGPVITQGRLITGPLDVHELDVASRELLRERPSELQPA
jgi:EAL domain-containing protein (putative c-di-GMP-specific phosphodiesterase class I)